jgi:hypothetical protein
VTSWTDSSGNGRDVSTASNTPSYQTNELNGLPVVRFDGIDDRFNTATSSFAFKHVFAVAKYSAATFPGGAVYPGLVSGDNSGSGHKLILVGETSTTRFFDDGGFTTVYYLNGTLTAEASMTGPMAAFAHFSISYSTGWSQPIAIGRDREFSGRYWDGDVAEIIAYDSVLSTTDRQAVEAYLADKWGL